ncbi:Pappalysin-1 [Plecturocebus cupreus]
MKGSGGFGKGPLGRANNPLIIPVVHDLSQPFYHSQAVHVSFSSPLVAISGVALRSFDNFDPVTLSSCERGETYSPAEQSQRRQSRETHLLKEVYSSQKCSGAISSPCNPCLPGSSDSHASASHVAGIIVEMGFDHAGQAGLELLTSSDPPGLAS